MCRILAASRCLPSPNERVRPVTASTTPPQLLDTLIESWERQQDAYVNHRAERFGIILDALGYARPELRTVLDIGGGLGSFSKLILERFPRSKVLTLDYDPAMLELARHNLRDYGDRSAIIEANLLDPAWPDALGDEKPDAIVSSTALHWLPTGKLIALYKRLATVLGQGGVFFNADHLSHSAPGSFFHTVSTADDTRQQQLAFAEEVPNWDGWWEQFRAVDGFVDLIAERDRRFSDAPENLETTPTLHTEALHVAGFTETGTLWQYFDDHIIYGIR
ncbi:MAG: methyltransferase domain-containing protein [Pseudonocardiaceae bacterium]|nr:methyltransferase domain-containing protein [Pseudonocardiaceae bacterium]